MPGGFDAQRERAEKEKNISAKVGDALKFKIIGDMNESERRDIFRLSDTFRDVSLETFHQIWQLGFAAGQQTARSHG